LIAFAAAAALAVPLYVYGLWEARQIRVVEQTLWFADLPPAFDGLRILQLSDLHTERFGPVERRLREMLKALPADLLVLVGDLRATVDTPLGPVVDSLLAIFDELDYPWGRVAVAGDHDGGGLWEALVGSGFFTCLVRSSLVLERDGQRVALLGTVTARPLEWIRGQHEIDEATWVGHVRVRPGPWGILPDGPASIRLADALNDGQGFRILLAHKPDHMVPAADAGIQLVLAGDTHGGQVCLPLVGALVRKGRAPARYVHGLYTLGGTEMVVTAGIGTKYLPIRILCPPEITLLTLRRTP